MIGRWTRTVAASLPGRGWPLLGYLLVFLALVGPQPAGRTGDALEYLVMAHGIIDSAHVSYGESDIVDADEWRQGVGLGYEGGDLRMPELFNEKRGAQEFPHFWMYPLAAAPFVAAAEWLDASPTWGFVALNGLLLAAVVLVALPRIGVWGTLLFALSPIVWWSNKVHTEVWTYSLLLVAMLGFGRRPRLGLILLGFAAAQNLPIAVALAAYGIASLVHDRRLIRSWTYWAAALAGAVVAATHPLYYQWRLGVTTPQELNGGAGDDWWYGLTKLLAPVLDLNIGLVVGFPASVALIALGTWWVIRRTRFDRDVAIGLMLSAAVGAWFLVAFAKTVNINSGGTVSMTRYALWLIPLAAPLVVHWYRHGPRAALAALATVSAALSILSYHPSRPDRITVPTPVAAYVWKHHPQWSNPAPEIFSERVNHADVKERFKRGDASAVLPTQYGKCAKVLVVGGVVPEPCQLPEIPDACRGEGMCYANRDDDRYSFRPVQDT